MTSSFLRFLDHTQWRITFGRTPLDEWSARRTDLYLTTHNTHNRQISMPPRWDSNPRSQQASGSRLRGYWDRQQEYISFGFSAIFLTLNLYVWIEREGLKGCHVILYDIPPAWRSNSCYDFLLSMSHFTLIDTTLTNSHLLTTSDFWHNNKTYLTKL